MIGSKDSMVLADMRAEARGNERLRDKIEKSELRVENMLLRREVDELRRARADQPAPTPPEGKPVLGQTPEAPTEPEESQP